MLIKKFKDGTQLEYDQGKFDIWCVYYTDVNGLRKPPLDLEYFEELVTLGGLYSPAKVYSDFVCVYEFVRKNKAILYEGHLLIDKISESYEEPNRADILFTILYSAMVAEERKANTKLGAKIKRLGVHQILVDFPPLPPKIAANFSRGMKWQAIDDECKKRGF